MKKSILILLGMMTVLFGGCPQAPTVTVSFQANGGEGKMEALVVEAGKEAVLPANQFAREGYTFLSWNKHKEGSAKSYGDKDKITSIFDVVLYAQWKRDGFDSESENPVKGLSVREALFNESDAAAVLSFSETSEWQPLEEGQAVTVSVYENNLPVPEENVVADFEMKTVTVKGVKPGENQYKVTFFVDEINRGDLIWILSIPESAGLKRFELTAASAVFDDQNKTVTLNLAKDSEWSWPVETVTVTVAENGIEKEARLDTAANKIVVSSVNPNLLGETRYAALFSVPGGTYQDLHLTWSLTLSGATNAIPDTVTVTFSPGEKWIPGDSVTVTIGGTGSSGVTVSELYWNGTQMSVNGNRFTVPSAGASSQIITAKVKLSKTGFRDVIKTLSGTVYPATAVRYDGKIFSLEKGFDFTQSTVTGAQLSVSNGSSYGEKTAINGKAEGYNFNNGNDTRIYLNLSGITFDLMTVNLKWANSGQPNFVFHGADGGAYGYQFYKAINSNKGWFLNGDWNTNGTGLSVTYNPAPAAGTFHTFRVCDQGNGKRSSQLNSNTIVRYNFTNEKTLSSHTESVQQKGNEMCVQFGNDTSGTNRNFTIKTINFYREVTD